MKLIIPLVIIFVGKFIAVNEVHEYMDYYRSTGKSDYKKENGIIEHYSYQNLEHELNLYFTDSSVIIRQKAYYFLFKKAMISNSTNKQKAVQRILKGCHDKNGGIVGQLLSYLYEFSSDDFTNEAKEEIRNLLQKKKIFHFKKYVLLAGKVNTAQEYFNKLFLNPESNNERKWILALALARQGSNEHLEYCMKRIENVAINSEVVSYLIPDLIYTRQKHAIDFCINIIYSDEKNCYSPNPDHPENILCAYRVMELLAPVIMNFPYEIDATGSLNTSDYEEALVATRDWLTENSNYQILQ